MSKKLLLVLLCLGLIATFVPSASAVPAAPPSANELNFDDHLRGHLSYPAVKRADSFVARQERLGARPASAAGYGKAGCEPTKTYEGGDQHHIRVPANVANTPTGPSQINSTLTHHYPRA